MKNNTSKNQSGFTLIEILLVMALIAALATIVLIAINPAQKFKQSRDTQRYTDVNNIAGAISQYYVDNKGQLPAGIPAAGGAAAAISDAGANLCSALVPKYLAIMPKDPSTGTGTGCTTYSTGYTVIRESDTTDRVVVAATPEAAASISVTR